jgi:hypothetical protein
VLLNQEKNIQKKKQREKSNSPKKIEKKRGQKRNNICRSTWRRA